MAIVILATNLHSPGRIEKISTSFNNHQKIIRWTVDIEDRENVMRIEALDGFSELDAIDLIQTNGFIGKTLES